jgi:hypothetical protein
VLVSTPTWFYTKTCLTYIKTFINKPFFYVKHQCDSDIVERQPYNDKDNEEGQIDKQLLPHESYSNKLKNIFQIV